MGPLGKAIDYLISLFIFVLGGGWAVMVLWNRTVVDIFILRPITYWDAIGLLMLTIMLFGFSFSIRSK